MLPKLAERIRRGEVVFFVGAGFSIDSEKMSAKEILWRIWIRLEALCGLLHEQGNNQCLAGEMWEQFRVTFLRNAQKDPRLDAGRPGSCLVPLEVEQLAARYYEVNEWVCDAFGRLIELTASNAVDDAGRRRFCDALKVKEQALFARAREQRDRPLGMPSALPDWILDNPTPTHGKSGEVPVVASPDLKGKATLNCHERGKLVLMTTLGFFDSNVMGGVCHGHEGGDPCRKRLQDMADVSSMYGGRLRLRHHVLARFAREGFCPTLITTNFDMLLEGALRLAGFEMDPAHDPASGKVGRPDDLPGLGNPLSLQIPYYDVISDPTGFYRRGKAYRTATLLKIHGCAGVMRAIAEQETRRGERMARYLPQVVYTYREIQHWRDDHWTADMLRTVLRTKSMVFAGYSTADPVVHDTFRSVYEEMEQRATEGVGSDHPQTSAPAYFLGYSGDGKSVEFHAQQVLRSASRAVGHPD
ncbi:MAG: SIR2 family protein, partial [Verrucomicrobiota bacterium]